MADESKQEEALPPEVQDVIRNFASAVRAVKLYPPNNPVYAQSVKKSHESFVRFFETAPRYTLGVQKTHFLYEQTPVGKDAQLNRTIAQDLFGKGMREFVFLSGLTEAELMGFCAALALSAEDQALRSGIISILWEQGAAHIKVTEAALEDVITMHEEPPLKDAEEDPRAAKISPVEAKKEIVLADRTLVVGDLINDPVRFGASLLDIARQTASEQESVEDRLHALYQEAGRQIQEQHAENSEVLFDNLAKSVLAMEPEHRDKFIASKLYGEMDAEQVRKQRESDAAEAEGAGSEGPAEEIPEELHEIVTGRYSKKWTVQQVSALLKKSASRKPEAPAPAVPPSEVAAAPISDDLYSIAQELAEYSPEEMEMLKIISDSGMESDITEASVRTLIFLLPLVRNPHRPVPLDQEQAHFSTIVRQLEDMLSYLLNHKDYPLATIIIRSYHLPVPPELRPRLIEAVKKASTREIIGSVITDMRSSAKGSPQYLEAYAYLAALDREATTVLLELLSVEKDRAIRKYLVEILKDLGRKQIAMIGRHISDGRWYVVRNIVNILGDSGSEDALPYLERVTGHKQPQIRQEVIKGLITIGGKKAAVLLTRFLNDADPGVQVSAIHGLSVINGAGRTEAKALTDLLEDRPVRKKENALTTEIIKVLAKIGDAEAAQFLQRYLKVRWWKPRKPQEEVRDAAEPAIAEIQRRQADAGRTG